jgi:hypothetical protein
MLWLPTTTFVIATPYYPSGLQMILPTPATCIAPAVSTAPILPGVEVRLTSATLGVSEFDEFCNEFGPSQPASLYSGTANRYCTQVSEFVHWPRVTSYTVTLRI